MSKKYDVVALGELLIDFTQNGLSSQGNTLFEANPGGAPCNVLANAAASIITTRRGALRVMPEKKEIEKLILAERR